MLSAPGMQADIGFGAWGTSICGGRRPLSKIYVAHQNARRAHRCCGSIDNEIGTSLPRLETLIVASALCRLLFLALSRVAAKIPRASPGGPRGRALHRRARGLLCFDLPRCTVPMFLMPFVQLPLRHPKRISALFDPPLLFRIHPGPAHSPSIAERPNLCLLPLQNTRRPPRAAASRQHTDG